MRRVWHRYPFIFPKSLPGAYDATPFQLNEEKQPSLLAGAMPPQLHARVRMVAVLREPASRLLSWYNHKVLTTSVVLTYLLTYLLRSTT